VLGITKERITLPGDVCGWLNSRSRFARIGLMSHIAAPFLAPGISNRQILEIYNAGRNKILLTPGMRICHLVLRSAKAPRPTPGFGKTKSCDACSDEGTPLIVADGHQLEDMEESPFAAASPNAREARACPCYFGGIFSFCPTLMRLGLVRMSLLASKIFGRGSPCRRSAGRSRRACLPL